MLGRDIKCAFECQIQLKDMKKYDNVHGKNEGSHQHPENANAVIPTANHTSPGSSSGRASASRA